MASPKQHEDPDLAPIKKELFNLAMQGKWEKVVDVYETNPKAHNTKITRSGDTALHVAVSDRKEDIVERLVQSINAEVKKPKEIDSSLLVKHPLQAANERGNTALHLAASIGNLRMCMCIAESHTELVGARNNENETPLFLAAFHGKKDAFLCLHEKCGGGHDEYCRRGDGETILHVSISGEYFDLAYQIIHKYPNLVNSFNEHGQTPLYLLASKPAAFRSGSRLGQFNRIIYHCIYVEKLKEESFSHHDSTQTSESKKLSEMFPKNYATCLNFFQVLIVLWNMIKIPLNRKKNLPSSGKNMDANRADLGKLEKGQGKNMDANKADSGKLEKRRVDEETLFPPNYYVSIELVKFMYRAMLVVLGLGSREIQKIQSKKEKNIWSVQIMNKLLESASIYEYDSSAGAHPGSTLPAEKDETVVTQLDLGSTDGGEATSAPGDENKTNAKKDQKPDGKRTTVKNDKNETPILLAAKNGIIEMVEKILELFPVAIHDMNSEKKNIVLLAVENRQPYVYGLLLKREILKESIFHVVDHNGNSALHLAAIMSIDRHPWLIPGAALQMQWEIKWYEYVKNSMPVNFFVRYNKDNLTAREIFTESHKDLVQKGGEWLNNTSNSCSVVAALIATVAFATSATVPGGVNEGSGTPTLEDQPAFNVFSISSLIALCFSVTSVVMFLAILTSRHQEKDFGSDLPKKLLFGLSSLFISIAAILVSFCAGHFFVLKDELKYAAFPIYAVTCLPVTFFAIMQFPLYLDLIWATFKKLPQRGYSAVS